jgi:hypothetical protein
LKHLALPTTTTSRKDYDAIRSKNTSTAQQALDSASISEESTILALGAVAGNLQKISFVRPESASSSVDSSIEYDISVISTHTLHIGDGVIPVVRHARVEISATAVRDAKYDQFDALPRLEASAHCGIREWQAAALSYAKENQIAAILAASTGGVLLGEAGRVLYAHSQGVVGV